MGTYTTNVGFYKPLAAEFVDVELQLNNNWDIADSAVRRLLEYEYSNLSVPSTENIINRSKFYKIYSNSTVMYFKSSNLWWQDPAAFVAAFQPGVSWFMEGYNFSPVSFDVAARLVKKSGGTTAEVEWAGALWELGGPMELNTNTLVIPIGGIPSTLCPAVNKYFNVYCGNTSSDFSMARVLIGTDGRLEFKRYGVDPSAGISNENRVELTNIVYNVEVTG